MNSEKETNNVYALNIEGDEIHISEAESGQNGYYCIGCKKELQAVKSKLSNRIDYFRHAPVDVKIERKCTYSDESFRHKLAKEILQRIKKIKVPSVYKYPPKGINGLINVIKESEYFEAHSVGIEKVFYEDNDGQVHWGTNNDAEEKNLLIRPDITFFDKSKKPTLLIELVATHKVKYDKLSKLKRLKIDCIQVIIPKDSPESIEKIFYTTTNTKWIYNYDEERTEYISVSKGSTEGISSIDEEQRKLFEESFICRQAQINNLIRTINRCLESKHHREIKESLGGEISRTTGNTEKFRVRLEQLRKESRDRVIERIKSEIESYKLQEEQFTKEEAEHEKYHRDLEARYIKKRSSIESEEKFIDKENSRKIGDMEIGGITINQRKRELDKETNEIEKTLNEEKHNIERLRIDSDAEPGKFEFSKEGLRRNFETNKSDLLRKTEFIEAEISGVRKLQNEFEESIRKKESELPRWVESETHRIEGENEDLRKRISDAIMQRNISGGIECSRRIKKILDARGILTNINEKQRYYKRYRYALECLKSGTYKSWIK